MAAGERLDPPARARLERAVAQAETDTGLQLCVYLGPAEGDPRRHAEDLMVAATSATSRPAVMLYVAPEARRVECVVAPDFTARVTDADARAAVDAMLPALADGRLVEGLEEGLRLLARAAGTGSGDAPHEELPDVLE